VTDTVIPCVALTYDNVKHTDGAGAQLLRIYGIYAAARMLGLPYIHTPLHLLNHQGLERLAAGSPDLEMVHKYNEVYTIASDIDLGDAYDIVELHSPSAGFETELLAESQRRGRPILTRLTWPFRMTDVFPEAYAACHEVSPFRDRPKRNIGDKLRVAIHMRRGDVRLLEPDRLLPNEYYVRIALGISRELEERGIPYDIELHTEVPKEDFVIQPGAWGTYRVEQPVVISSRDDSLEDFDVIPNLVRCYNEPAMLTLEKLCTADMVVLSKSAFGYLAALLNVDCLVFYPRFFHSPRASWIITEPTGEFDVARLREFLSAR
jgi:hypothetical protein